LLVREEVLLAGSSWKFTIVYDKLQPNEQAFFMRFLTSSTLITYDVFRDTNRHRANNNNIDVATGPSLPATDDRHPTVIP